MLSHNVKPPTSKISLSDDSNEPEKSATYVN